MDGPLGDQKGLETMASDNQHYWSTILNAIACIMRYLSARDDDSEFRIRYQEFPECVERARAAYKYCRQSNSRSFDLSTADEVDEFFSGVLANKGHLDQMVETAAANYNVAAAPLPMRIFCLI